MSPQRSRRINGSPSANPATTPTPPAIQLASGAASGISSDDGRDHRRPEQVSVDLLPAPQGEQVGERPRAQQRQRGAVGAHRDRQRIDGRGDRDPADAADQEQRQYRRRTVAPLHQPAEEGDRSQRDHRVTRVDVYERRGEQPPPMTRRVYPVMAIVDRSTTPVRHSSVPASPATSNAMVA